MYALIVLQSFILDKTILIYTCQRENESMRSQPANPVYINNTEMNIVIRLHTDQRAIVQIVAPDEEGYVIGRSDETSDFLPDIDLAKYSARELGVSRRHAALVRYLGTPHLIDLNSVNGTFLNGRRLIPDMPYPVEFESSVRLGTLQLEFDWVS